MSKAALTFKNITDFVKDLYGQPEFLPLHEPHFGGNEKKYLNETIDTRFVSSVGEFVTRFERMLAEYVGAKYAVAATTGTAALHIALKIVGVEPDHEVITQPLTFIATCNAISYTGARPVFVDVDRDTLGMSPLKLRQWLETNTTVRGNSCINKKTGKVVKACVPMHTFGLPIRILEIVDICKEFKLELVEDAAESLGSYVGSKHTGLFGRVGTFSFNGNKTITTGGGGMLTTDDPELAKLAKHLTTTAKVPHAWEFVHDMIGYNYRLPNLNAALGCAQLEQLPQFLNSKRRLAACYRKYFANQSIKHVSEREGTIANYWLNAIILPDSTQRDAFLAHSAEQKVMCRPIWRLMTQLPMYESCERGDIRDAEWLEQRVVNLPSSAYPKNLDRLEQLPETQR